MLTTTAGRVLVIGSINEDLTLAVAQLPGAGSTVLASSMFVGPGGKGANQAVAAARAGAHTSFVACVGDDARGTELIARLTDEGVDTEQVDVAAGQDSGLALITVDETGDNSIVVLAGANSALRVELIERAVAQAAPDDVVLLQCEIPADCVDAAVAAARAAGVRVVLNLAPFRDHPSATLSGVTVLVVNEPEAHEVLAARDIRTDIPAPDLAATIATVLNVACVVTLGARGSVLATPDGEHQVVPAVEVANVVDTTGAGDAYVGVLAAALSFGAPLPEAMAAGTTAAALSVTRLGALTSYASSSELGLLISSSQPTG